MVSGIGEQGNAFTPKPDRNIYEQTRQIFPGEAVLMVAQRSLCGKMNYIFQENALIPVWLDPVRKWKGFCILQSFPLWLQ
ncbi:MAG: hypothetical protein MUE99_07995, partial [Chitinophagaceae bacterium]|nr:hypothetical protein [Chitinophagaceae bacterium]